MNPGKVDRSCPAEKLPNHASFLGKPSVNMAAPLFALVSSACVAGLISFTRKPSGVNRDAAGWEVGSAEQLLYERVNIIHNAENFLREVTNMDKV